MNFLVLSEVNSGFSLDRLIIDYFNNLGPMGNFILVIISLILSIILGGAIGLQREVSGHAAGLRTHVLFSLGCCLLTVISIYGAINGFNGEFDRTRITAGVVGGAGFLGAGTIIHNGVTVKGLTTATTLWMSMAIGVACGSGWLVIAAISTLFALIVLIFFSKIENFATRKSVNILLICKRDVNAVSRILELSDYFDVLIKELNTTLALYNSENVLRITFLLLSRDKKKMEDFITNLKVDLPAISIEKIK